MGEVVLLDELNLFADRATEWKDESHRRNEGAESIIEYHRNGRHVVTAFMKIGAPTTAIVAASTFGCWAFAPDQMYTSWEIGPAPDGECALIVAGVDRSQAHILMRRFNITTVNGKRRLHWRARESADDYPPVVRARRGLLECIRSVNVHEKMQVDPNWSELFAQIPNEEERIATVDARAGVLLSALMPWCRGLMMMSEHGSARHRILAETMGPPTAAVIVEVDVQEDGMTTADLSEIEKLLRESAPE